MQWVPGQLTSGALKGTSAPVIELLSMGPLATIAGGMAFNGPLSSTRRSGAELLRCGGRAIPHCGVCCSIVLVCSSPENAQHLDGVSLQSMFAVTAWKAHLGGLVRRRVHILHRLLAHVTAARPACLFVPTCTQEDSGL